MMTDAEEIMKGEVAEVHHRSLREDPGVPHRNLREDVGVRHLVVTRTMISVKTGDTDCPKTIRRSTNNHNKTETDERANLVRKTGLYWVVAKLILIVINE